MSHNSPPISTALVRLLLLTTPLTITSQSQNDNIQNVYGHTLVPCSTAGMALTGYTKTGYCVNQHDDVGSHHICIDLVSPTGGNFCEVTGQPDWCSSRMPCVHDRSADCQRQNWCVCQWVFASYVERAGGCDKIQNIVCNATNWEAYRAYEHEAATRDGSGRVRRALDCLKNRCNLRRSSADISASGDVNVM